MLVAVSALILAGVSFPDRFAVGFEADSAIQTSITEPEITDEDRSH
jgi:hypothetical protein